MSAFTQQLSIRLATVTLCAGLLASNVQASDYSGSVRSVAVNYSDLSLQTSDGVKTLYKRLKAASRHVCHSHEGRELARTAAWQHCYDQALSSAVARVNVTRLTALHHKSSSALS